MRYREQHGPDSVNKYLAGGQGEDGQSRAGLSGAVLRLVNPLDPQAVRASRGGTDEEGTQGAGIRISLPGKRGSDLPRTCLGGAAPHAADRRGDAWRRVVVEKPFGRDLASARALNQRLARRCRESQIYRIDHYLGKETVQNIMAFRFANGIFEPIWNRRYIDHVQITVAETVGVEDRGRLLRHGRRAARHGAEPPVPVARLTAMEPPISFERRRVRDERVKVLHAIRPFTPDAVARDVVRGQYGAGSVDGTRRAGLSGRSRRWRPTRRPRPTSR